MKGRSAVKKMDVLFILLIAAFLVVFLVACASPLVVGDDIKFNQISDFYYTIDASTNPPFFLRYRVYTVDGVHTFYHEERSGDHWPLTDNDATVIEKREMTEEEWDSFCKCIADGKVTKRTDSVEAGSSGPWLYLYWSGDKGTYQVFEFRDLDAQYDFRKWCEGMVATMKQ